MKCKKCGFELREEAVYCPKCGTKVEVGSIEAPQQPAVQNPSAAATPVNSVQNNQNNTTQKKSNAGKIIVTLVTLIIIAVVAVIIVINNAETPEEKAIREASEAAAQLLEQMSEYVNIPTKSETDVTEVQTTESKTDVPSTAAPTTEAKMLINPFEYISLQFYGANGRGSVYLTANNSSVLNEIYYRIECNDGYLSNGDIVNVVFDKDEFVIYHSEYDVKTTEKSYSVSGLEETNPRETYVEVPYYLRTSDSTEYKILSHASTAYYSEDFIVALTDEQLRYARNEICASVGRIYSPESEYYDYFMTKPWYNPIYEGTYFDEIIDSIINQYEKANLDLINLVESSRRNGN